MKVILLLIIASSFAFAGSQGRDRLANKKCRQLIEDYKENSEDDSLYYQRRMNEEMIKKCPTLFPREDNVAAQITEKCVNAIAEHGSQEGTEDDMFTTQVSSGQFVNSNLPTQKCINLSYVEEFEKYQNQDKLCKVEVESRGEEKICKCVDENGSKRCTCLSNPRVEQPRENGTKAYYASSTSLILGDSLIGPESSATVMAFLDFPDTVVNEELGIASTNEVLQYGYQVYYLKEFKDTIVDPQHLQMDQSGKMSLQESEDESQKKEVRAVHQAACQFHRVKCKKEPGSYLAIFDPQEIELKSGNGYLHSDDAAVEISDDTYVTLQVNKGNATYKCQGHGLNVAANSPGQEDGELNKGDGPETSDPSTGESPEGGDDSAADN